MYNLSSYPDRYSNLLMADLLQNTEHKTAIYDCLSHSHRRYALHYLNEAAEPLALTELAEAIADWETDSPESEIADEVVEDVRTTLHHIHIPKLVEGDLVQYDQEQDLVGILDGSEELVDSGQVRLA